MKVRTTILACAATLLASTWAEAQLPPGSYKDTCTNEAVTGNVLKAKCKTMAGTMIDTSLNLPCTGMVENINGKLVCKPGPLGAPKPPAPPAALPAGSYQQTCSGEKVSGNMLGATCRNKAGMMVPSSLPLPCAGQIENIDGKLTCKGAAGAPPGPALPPGSYQETCSGEKVSGNMLGATCRNKAGMMVPSSLPLPCAGPIENIDGRLTCKPPAGLFPGRPAPQPAPAPALPPGSYQQTCTGEKVVGNTLMADCRRKDQSMAKTQLVLPCPGRIENQDGKLACVR